MDVDEAEGALHLVRTREVATQFCGNDASIQTAYVPTTMGAAHPAFKAMTEATDAAMNSLDPASFLEQPPPPPPQPYMYGYPPQPYMMMPPPPSVSCGHEGGPRRLRPHVEGPAEAP